MLSKHQKYYLLVSGFCCLICKACLILKIRGKIDLKIKLICEHAVGWAQGSGKRQRVDTTFFVIDFYRLVSEINYNRILSIISPFQAPR